VTTPQVTSHFLLAADFTKLVTYKAITMCKQKKAREESKVIGSTENIGGIISLDTDNAQQYNQFARANSDLATVN
jgi:hypothetical protein